MLGALIHCWVQLAGVLGGEKTYLGSSIIIKIYPALSLAIGGRDGMDGGGGHWMTCSIIRTRHQSWRSGALPRCWVHLAGGVKTYSGFIILIKLALPFPWLLGGAMGWMQAFSFG